MSSPRSADRAAGRAAGVRRRGPRLDRLDRHARRSTCSPPIRTRSRSSPSPPARTPSRLTSRRPGPAAVVSPAAPRRSTCRRPTRGRRRRAEALATRDDVDLVVVATGGVVSLRPVLAALAAGKVVATANKETLVAGGHLVMPLARRARRRARGDGPARPVRQPARLAPPDRLRALGDLAVPRRRVDGAGRVARPDRLRRAVPRRAGGPRDGHARAGPRATRPGRWARRSRSTRRPSRTRAWRSSKHAGCTMSPTTRSRWSSIRRASSTQRSGSWTAP